MFDELARERAALELADRDIALGRARIERQEAALRNLCDDDAVTASALRTLKIMRETLAEWEVHRTLIEARIAYLEAG